MADFDQSLKLEPDNAFVRVQHGKTYSEWLRSNMQFGNTDIRQFYKNTYVGIKYVDPLELANINCLATGGFGTVYTAIWQKSNNVKVALKSIHNKTPFNRFLFQEEVCTV